MMNSDEKERLHVGFKAEAAKYTSPDHFSKDIMRRIDEAQHNNEPIAGTAKGPKGRVARALKLKLIADMKAKVQRIESPRDQHTDRRSKH